MPEAVRGVVLQVSISDGGVPKLPVASVGLTFDGLVGDVQRDRKHHGGPDRAVCVFAAEVIDRLGEDGHSLFPGAAGENVTVRGIDWTRVVPGSTWRIGESAVIQVTGYAAPCKTNARWFAGGKFRAMSQKKFPGRSRVYARVVSEGQIAPGDAFELIG